MLSSHLMSEESDDKTQKPKLPDGMREVRVGEMIRVGDYKWDDDARTWREIVSAVNIRVLPQRAGFYCRNLID